MLIKTRPGVWVFAVLTTLVSLVMTQALVIFIFPPEVLLFTMRGAAIIVLAVTMPICLWVGSKIRENTLLSAELQRLVDRDRLTDVATRDYFFGRMAASPNAYGVSLMIDIDHFKAINDAHGHIVGDAVIRAVAKLLRKSVRPGDIVARFGGEEFVVFLYDQPADAGYRVAERMREMIAQHNIQFEGISVSVTVSIGGSLKEACADIERAIQEADAALYKAKRGGRNRTVFDSDLPSAVAV